MTQVSLRGAVLALLLSAAGLAQADGPRLGTATDPLWQQECGSCHVPYPPRLLPAASWNAVMDGLERHFGTDASLAPAENAAIRRFLVDNAGRGTATRDGKPLLRITQTPWFLREHGEELPASVWQRKAVGSAANCGACHVNAAKGRFSEHEIRIPGGGRGHED